MTTIADLREALDAIPAALLGDDDAQVLRETRTSLAALEDFDVVPTVVVFVGSSGSGKSSLVNAILGVSAMETGPIRPTTQRVVMVGSSGPVSLSAESEYLHVPSVRPGLLVVDTPAWEHDPAGVESAVVAADLMVVVTTPSRYGDASIADLVAAFGGDRPSALVLNRVDVPDVDRDLLVRSVEEQFGMAPIVVDEHGDLTPAANRLVDLLRIDSVAYQRSAVLRSAAASGTAYLAGRMGDVVVEMRRLGGALDRLAPAPASDRLVLPVADDWDATRALLVDIAADESAAVDQAVVADGGPMARRLETHLPAIDRPGIEAQLDDWRDAVTDSFLEAATIRWRRASGRSMIADHAWRVALSTAVRTPRRFRRMMGDRLASSSREGRRRIDVVFDGAIERRVDAWRTEVQELGAYAPGELLAAAEEFGKARILRG